MQYTTIVDHSEDGLQIILDKAQAFDRESVLDGILQRRYTTYDIEQMVTIVMEYHARLRREINGLVKFSQTFNHQFATDNNTCFDTAERLFRKIRSSVSGTKKIYKKFCKTIRTRYYENDGEVKKMSVFTHSILTSGCFSPDMFGESSFPKVVKLLCDELESFFKDLEQIILVCMAVTKEEQRIRENSKYLNDLYTSQSNLCKESQRTVVAYLKSSGNLPLIDPMTKHKMNHTFQAFLQEAFHRFDCGQFRMHVLNEELTSGLNDGLDKDEALFWPDRHELVPQIRLVINYFDELNPQGRKDHTTGKYKIRGEVLSRLVRWCCLEGSKFEAPFVDNYFHKHYQGEFLPVNSGAVNAAKNKFTRQGGDPEYEDFVKRVEALVAKYSTQKAVQVPLASKYSSSITGF